MVLDSYTAVAIAEGFEEATEEAQIQAWQYLIDTGLVWQLQGTFGRTATDLIEAQICTPPSTGQEAQLKTFPA